MTDQALRIRELNDRFRKGDSTVPGRLMMTAGVQTLVEGDQAKTNSLLNAVRDFDAFNQDNDPHGEHDFAVIDFDGERLFWKLDYYAPDMEHGSDDPADTSKTLRVLTIMLAEEY